MTVVIAIIFVALAPGSQAHAATETNLGGATRSDSSIDRYQTSAVCATVAIGYGMSFSNIGIATGEAFPDGVSGAAGQGKLGRVLLLAATGHTGYAASWLSGKVGSSLTWYGGEVALPYKGVKRVLRVPIASINILSWNLLDPSGYVTWYGSITHQTSFNEASRLWNNVRPNFYVIRQATSSALSARSVVIGNFYDSADIVIGRTNGALHTMLFNEPKMNPLSVNERIGNLS
jgi:hypothetical protein